MKKLPEVIKMQPKETEQKTVRMDRELIEKIEIQAKKAERDFSGQVRYMLKEYLRIMQNQ